MSVKCTEYIEYDNLADWSPCHCPVCGSFLEWNPEKIHCKKCGTELLVIADLDPDTGEPLDFGKICPISERTK